MLLQIRLDYIFLLGSLSQRMPQESRFLPLNFLSLWSCHTRLKIESFICCQFVNFVFIFCGLREKRGKLKTLLNHWKLGVTQTNERCVAAKGEGNTRELSLNLAYKLLEMIINLWRRTKVMEQKNTFCKYYVWFLRGTQIGLPIS